MNKSDHVNLAKLFVRTFYNHGQHPPPPTSWQDRYGGGCSKRCKKRKKNHLFVPTPGLCIFLVDFVSDASDWWVEKQAIFHAVKANPEMILRALSYLEDEDFVIREDRAGTTTYFAMNFPRLLDSIQLRLARLESQAGSLRSASMTPACF